MLQLFSALRIGVKSLPNLMITSDDKKGLPMQVIPNSTSNLIRFRDLMTKKFKESEGLYYTHIDDLVEKLADIDIGQTLEQPDFELNQFPFLLDWEFGHISSQEVCESLQHLKPAEVAHKHLTRKLTNYMMKNDEAREYIKSILPDIKERICPIYTRYIELLQTYFSKLAFEDARQVPMTWLEVTVKPDNSMTTRIDDMPFNQVLNYIDTYFIHDIDQTGFFLGKNIFVIHETGEPTHGAYTTHWIFGPESYVDMTKHLYDVTNELDLETDGAYINGLIKEFANDKEKNV
jgi:hypothetical protein